MISARDHALAELDAVRLPHWPANLMRRRGTLPDPRGPQDGQRPAPADPRDRALAERIIQGVIKNLLHLQWLIAYYTRRPIRQIDPLAQKIIAIGLYQLRFLSRIPPSAAVDQAVEQAKRVGHRHAAGFVNAVLRNATRDPGPQLPDRLMEPARYAEIALSHPPPLYVRLERLLGAADAIRFCEHDNAEAPTIVRLFPSATAEELRLADPAVMPHEQPGLYVISQASPMVLADWAARGIAQVQDPTAAGVVAELDVRPGQRVLDRCCGLGTKTMQLQLLVGSDGTVVAMDPAELRIRTLHRLVQQRGIDNVSLHQGGMLADLPTASRGSFDRVLIDAPCSNSGVMARRADARYHQDESTLASLSRLQLRILDDTAGALRPGGLLVYSTCSIWPEENQRQIERFLQRHTTYRLVKQRTILPSFVSEPRQYHDGGYCAVLERT